MTKFTCIKASASSGVHPLMTETKIKGKNEYKCLDVAHVIIPVLYVNESALRYELSSMNLSKSFTTEW